MKISEVIKKLQGLLQEHGDIEVISWPYDGQDKIFPVKDILILEIESKGPFIEIIV